MPLSLAELARRCGATLRGGKPELRVAAAAPLLHAGPDEVAPLSDPRYAPLLADTRAAAVILKRGSKHPKAPADTALLYAEDPELAFLRAVQALHPETPEKPGVDERACVESGARLGQGVYVGPFAVIRAGARIGEETRVYGGAHVGRACQVGARCRLHPNVVLYDGVRLGDEVIVHAGTVLGADGFGYKFRSGRHLKVPQAGILRVASGVEIGANAAVDRAALGETRIEEGAKIDNLVQIGHNTRIGKHAIVCGHAGMSGSVSVGDFAVIGGMAGIGDHLTIGAAAKLGAKTGVTRDVPPGAEMVGYPAERRRAAWRQFAALKKLPELLRRVAALEKEIQRLQEEGRGP